jgi:hypothetical protein
MHGARPSPEIGAQSHGPGGDDMTAQTTEPDTAGATDQLDELGPVDWIVVEFPGSTFNGKLAGMLDDLVARRTIRVLDLVIIRKDADGAVDLAELNDLDDNEAGGLRGYETALAMLLSEADVMAAAAAVAPGSTAALLVWENLWAAPFGAAVRHMGGQLVASGRIPIQALLSAIEEDDLEEDDTAEDDIAAADEEKES